MKRFEGSKSQLYLDLYEGGNLYLGRALQEVYRRMDTVCSRADKSYWFKFWMTASRALFPDTAHMPRSLKNFNFLTNPRSINSKRMN